GFMSLGPVAHGVAIIDCAPCAHRLGGGLDLGRQHGIAGQAENEADIGGIAPVHHLRSSVMAVATDGDAGVWPVPTDAPDQPAEVATDLRARERTSPAQE